jgi:predicted Zn-dependent protease
MMERMMGDMSRAMARNPATGFRDVLAGREREVLAEVRLSAQEERRIGRAFRERYLKAAADRGYPLHRDDSAIEYLRDLVGLFHKRMRHRERYERIEIDLIKASKPDGQAFPGGRLVFTTGLLDSADEATVAGVVAHELAHLDLGHVFEYARRAKMAESGIAGAQDFESMMTRGMALGSLMMNPYRPEHELEADCQAATWLYQEGYDPRALVRFFERLHREQNDQPDSPFFAIARSHPYTLDRREHVLDRMRQLRRWKPREDLGLFAENLQQRITRARQAEEAHRDRQEADRPAPGEEAGEAPRSDVVGR